MLWLTQNTRSVDGHPKNGRDIRCPPIETAGPISKINDTCLLLVCPSRPPSADQENPAIIDSEITTMCGFEQGYEGSGIKAKEKDRKECNFFPDRFSP